jgi:hypothetical protein
MQLARAQGSGTRPGLSRREDATWKIIGAFVIVCGLLTALILVM